MAHQIELVDGKHRFAYTGHPGWHGLGTKAPDNVTPSELGDLAQINWTVSKRTLKTTITKTGEDLIIGDKFALTRDDDDTVLDIVGKDWTPNQNSEVFKLFDRFYDTGLVAMETAGSLRNGRMIFMLAKMKDGFDVIGGKDPHAKYILFSNPHESGHAVTVTFVATRVVCNNTLQIALSENAKNEARFRHVSKEPFTVERAVTMLGVIPNLVAAYKAKCETLASKKLPADGFIKLVKSVYGLKEGKDVPEAQKSSNERIIERLKTCFVEQPGVNIGEGTWYQAYHAITFDNDHVIGRSSETRFNSAQYGAGKNRKQQALDLAFKLATV
jgi:phage/plasmid-like protein (TIGR03299 family)